MPDGPEDVAAENEALRVEIEALQTANRVLRGELETCRLLVAQVMDSEDQGRRRIAQLIHDDSLQALLAANQELIEAAPGRPQVERAHEVVEAAIGRLREAMMALHPVTLEQGGFEQALRAIARQEGRHGSFEVSVELDPAAIGVEDELMVAIARELLTNAARHSGATAVSVALRRVGEGLELEVIDDGSGIAPGRRDEALAQGHIGLASVNERLRAVGGEFTLASKPGATRALARLPLREAARVEEADAL